MMQFFKPGTIWYNSRTNHLYAIISVTDDLVAYFTPYEKEIRHKAFKEFELMFNKGNFNIYAEV